VCTVGRDFGIFDTGTTSRAAYYFSKYTLLVVRYKSTEARSLYSDKSSFTGEGFSNIEIVTK